MDVLRDWKNPFSVWTSVEYFDTVPGKNEQVLFAIENPHRETSFLSTIKIVANNSGFWIDLREIEENVCTHFPKRADEKSTEKWG